VVLTAGFVVVVAGAVVVVVVAGGAVVVVASSGGVVDGSSAALPEATVTGLGELPQAANAIRAAKGTKRAFGMIWSSTSHEPGPSVSGEVRAF
jgi:hypothetical protein